MSRPGFRIRLTVRGLYVTGIHRTVRLHCIHHKQPEISTEGTNHARLRIRADGRFRFSESYRDLEPAGQETASSTSPRGAFAWPGRPHIPGRACR